jgi:transcriptional regulator with XRE-family HTH domain
MTKKRMTPADAEVARRLRLLRTERKVSQTEVAEHLGLQPQQVQKYETGINRIAAGRLQEIADFFEVPIALFFEQPKNLKQEGLEVFGFLDTPQALRLLKAFSKIADDAQRSALLNLAESMVARPGLREELRL